MTPKKVISVTVIKQRTMSVIQVMQANGNWSCLVTSYLAPLNISINSVFPLNLRWRFSRQNDIRHIPGNMNSLSLSGLLASGTYRYIEQADHGKFGCGVVKTIM